MRDLLLQEFDKLLAVILFGISVGLLLGVISTKTTDLYTLAELLVSQSFSAVITLLTGKAVVNLLKNDPPKQ